MHWHTVVWECFQSLPDTSFVVNGAPPDLDSVLVSAGAEKRWLNGFALAATFEGEFSDNATSYAGKVRCAPLRCRRPA